MNPLQPRPQMEEMVTQMWQHFQQQPILHTAQHTHVYNSQPHHVPPPPNTHHTEFPCYLTPTLPSVHVKARMRMSPDRFSRIMEVSIFVSLLNV